MRQLQESVFSRGAARGPREGLARALAYIILALGAFASVAPFVWAFFGSFKSYIELTSQANLWPKEWTLANYRTIVLEVNFVGALWNSALVAVVVTFFVLLTSAAAGYVFAKYRFWGKEQLFLLLLSTMMVPFAVIVVPLYITVADLGLANKLEGVTVTGLCSTFGIFMMRQFMESLPDELIDAGRVDGASEWWLFARVVLPLATSPLAALAVFTFLGNWDNFFWPYIVLTSQRVWTLPLVMAGLKMLYSTRYELYCAASMFTVVPVMLLYAVAQRQFVRGIAMTGLKA